MYCLVKAGPTTPVSKWRGTKSLNSIVAHHGLATMKNLKDEALTHLKSAVNYQISIKQLRCFRKSRCHGKRLIQEKSRVARPTPTPDLSVSSGLEGVCSLLFLLLTISHFEKILRVIICVDIIFRIYISKNFKANFKNCSKRQF